MDVAPDTTVTASWQAVRLINRIRRLILLLWTVLVLCSLVWNVYIVRVSVQRIAYLQAHSLYDKDLLYRRWNAMHGGVYVPVTPETPPNPYLQKLNIPELLITTPSGRLFTLMNPAYMTRQVLDLQKQQLNIKGHLASLKPINPNNTPDTWEREILLSFEKGVPDASLIEVIDGQPYMRVMHPFITEKPCLRCHEAQGYKVGDVRGGISVAVPMKPFYEMRNLYITILGASHGLIWLLGGGGILYGFARYRHSERLRAQAEEYLTLEHQALLQSHAELQQTLEQVKQLEGIIPICMFCKKIRDDQQLWNNLESYISHHSAAEFSHSICPDCLEKHYGEYARKNKDRPA